MSFKGRDLFCERLNYERKRASRLQQSLHQSDESGIAQDVPSQSEEMSSSLASHQCVPIQPICIDKPNLSLRSKSLPETDRAQGDIARVYSTRPDSSDYARAAYKIAAKSQLSTQAALPEGKNDRTSASLGSGVSPKDLPIGHFVFSFGS